MPTRIFDFALVTEWESRLRDLETLAEPERWTYISVPDKSPLPVLDGYVKNTFLRAFAQGKVVTTERVACFNTGLLTPSQEEIFGVFTVADRYLSDQPLSPTNKMWFLKAWARAGDRILTEFSSLPPLASYWDDAADLIFNPALHVQLNVDHIVRDNLSRFPVELGGQLEIDGTPRDLKEPEAYLAEDADEAGDESIDDIPLATRNALEGAMKHSIRLAQRTYRVAVPQFYRERIQLLLPIYLRDTKKPDLALTLERHGDWYRAATVLYPDWAYKHARLLSRPNSEWLGGFRKDLLIDGVRGECTGK